MIWFQAIILGIIQGLTEFLPVSSSGHLVVGQKLFRISEPPVFFDVLVHLGTLVAILVFFRRQLIKISFKTIWLTFIGTLPAIFIGLFLNKYLKFIFNSLIGVGFAWLVTAAFLFSSRWIKKSVKGLAKLREKNAFIIGCWQALAILPGISRSGSTVIGGLWQGLEKESAFSFSFYLAIPAILGAFILQLPDLPHSSFPIKEGFLGFISAAIFGLLSLGIFKKVVLKGKLFYFGFYCLILGLTVLLKVYVS